MKKLNQSIVLATLAAFPALAMSQTSECQSQSVNMKAVALTAPRTGPVVNFTGSGGQLDPAPLLETSINVATFDRRPVCVAVVFSAQADPGDNYAVYQASIDNVPMAGHGALSEYGLSTPIIFDAVNQSTLLPSNGFVNPANSRFVSYTFFASVMPGTHTIRLRLASCCSPVTPGGAHVRAATLVVKW